MACFVAGIRLATPEGKRLLAGTPVGRTIANCYRTDLHGAGSGVGRAGFRFALPSGCDDLGAATVLRACEGARLPVAEQVSAT